MLEAPRCPNCGAPRPPDALEGLCPRCLLGQGLGITFTATPDGVGRMSRAGALGTLAESLGDVPRVLLRDHEREGDTPVSRPASPELPARDSVSGRYQLLGEIARGGMGAILKGRDADLGRDLAIKVLLEEHRDHPDIARRFVEEAQIGGQLQHPGIVPVYELGVFPDRRPYFAMKLVKGRTLAGLLESRPDPGHDRPRFLGIFEQVCQTMAYAHARGVIHRDLKPSNVMVGSFGEVQVMDWGLAKVLASGGAADDARGLPDHDPLIRTARSGSADGASQAGSVMGTPAYMPPEQARGEVATIDERADVFALGAILCEVLTGRPPYVARSSAELRRMAAGAELADALGRLAACGADEELIALARRCLAPDPSDRPRDAGEVARALTAYLAGVQERLRAAELQRVEAQARAAEERKRRRAERTMAAGLLVVLAAGIAGVASQWRRAEANLQAAKTANRDLELSVAREVRARDQAQARFRLANAAIERFYTGASEDVLLKEPRLKALRARLLGSALEFYKDLQSDLDAGAGEAPRSELAAAYQRVGDITRDIGSLPDALEAQRRALAIRERLASDHPEDPQIQGDLARSTHLVAAYLNELARPAEALPMYRSEVEIRERLARDHPERREAQDRLLASVQENIGLIVGQIGSPAEGLEWLRRSLASHERLAAGRPEVPEYQNNLAGSRFNLGSQLSAQGRLDEAIREVRLAAEAQGRLAGRHPNVAEYRKSLALSHTVLGILLTHARRPDDAMKEHERAAEVQEGLVRDHPTNVSYRRDLGLTYTGVADLLAKLGRPSEALVASRRAAEIQGELASDNPEVVLYRTDVALSQVLIGQQLRALGRGPEASRALRQAATIYERLADPSPTDLFNLACCYAQLSGLGRRDGPDGATSYADLAVATLRRASAAGHMNIGDFADDPSLAPIRSRADFRELLMDLAFPEDPFAG
jgi:serine/threonine protein kinase